MRKLNGGTPTRVQTLFPQPGNGYIYSDDYLTATFLPGRNVVKVEATSLDGTQYAEKVCQIGEFSKGLQELEDLLSDDERGIGAIEAVLQYFDGTLVSHEFYD